MKGAARATEEKSMGFQENILMRTSAPYVAPINICARIFAARTGIH